MSFSKVEKWVGDLEESETDNQTPIIKFLVGNKIDLVNQQQVST